MNATTQPWDVTIIGGGSAGCAAAMVLVRCRRRVLVIDEGKHRNKLTGGIHNDLTRDGISPKEFTEISHCEMTRRSAALTHAR